MEDSEGPFQAGAVDEVLRRAPANRYRNDADEYAAQGRHTQTETEDETEDSPLIAKVPSVGVESHHTTDSTPWIETAEYKNLPWSRRPSVFWLLPGFLPFCLAFGGLLVPRTYLILDLMCQEYLSDRSAKDPNFHFMPVILGGENPQCSSPENEDDIQKLVTRFMLFSSLLSGLFSAIVAPKLGALSDSYGRKKIIIFSTLGALCSEIITIIVGTHPRQISVYWILFGNFLDGICGSFTTSMAISIAYAADSTPADRRNVAFGYFHGMLFTGIALGPILAGFLMKWAGNIMIVFYVAVACHLYYISFLGFIVPESLTKERQLASREKVRKQSEATKHETWQTKLRSYNLFEPLWILRPRGPGSSPALRRNLSLLAAIDTTMFGVAMGTFNIILIYAKKMFRWDGFQSTIFLSSVNVVRVSVLIVVLPLITRLIRGPRGVGQSGHHGADRLDLNLIHIAIALELLGYIGYATSTMGGMFIFSGTIAAIGGIGSPTLSSALTKHIPPNRTGQVLGAMGLLHALARVVAPLIFSSIYYATVHTFPRTVFICLGSVFVVVFAMSWFVKPHVQYNDPKFHFATDGASNIAGQE